MGTRKLIKIRNQEENKENVHIARCETAKWKGVKKPPRNHMLGPRHGQQQNRLRQKTHTSREYKQLQHHRKESSQEKQRGQHTREHMDKIKDSISTICMITCNNHQLISKGFKDTTQTSEYTIIGIIQRGNYNYLNTRSAQEILWQDKTNSNFITTKKT
jgi:hypothetical protein